MSHSGSVILSETVRGKQRKQPVWVLRYRLGDKQSDKTLGKAWLKKSKPPEGFLTKGGAEVAAQAFFDEHTENVPIARKTFERACQDFIRDCERDGLRGSTLNEYRRITRHLCERPWRSVTWSERPIEGFSASELLALREELLEEGKASQSLNQMRRVLRGVFGTGPSALIGWDFDKRKPESKGKLHFYTSQQLEELMQAARNDVERALFTLAAEAGARRSEILALKLIDCDFEAGLVRFEDGYTATGGLAGTKGHRVRSVPMTEHVEQALTPLCQGPKYDSAGNPVLVFSRMGGQPLVPSTVTKFFQRAARKASLPRIRFHDLRHSFGTQAIRKVDIYTLQRLMGHESISTTQIYLHYAPDPNLRNTLTSLFATEKAEVIPLRQAG